ncbi:hypothetical protein [Aquitalea sp.]|nr:hypothetical protein [Aquitalea sp.]
MANMGARIQHQPLDLLLNMVFETAMALADQLKVRQSGRRQFGQSGL